MVVIMIKLLDYYYLVLLRYFDHLFGKDKVSYHVPGIVGFTLTVNLFSFTLLINHYLIDNNCFWLTIGIIGALIIIAIDLIYNKKRRERIRQEYRRESRESRRRGVLWVVVYGILSFTLLVGTIFLAVKLYSP
jgi:hypothetical protein